MNKILLGIISLIMLMSCNTTHKSTAVIDPLWGEDVKINPKVPPGEIQLIQIVLDNKDVKLRESKYYDKVERKTLGNNFSVIIGSCMNGNNPVKIFSKCEATSHDIGNSAFVNAWRCEINAIEYNKENEFIASGTIQFLLDRKNWKLFPETVVCY